MINLPSNKQPDIQKGKSRQYWLHITHFYHLQCQIEGNRKKPIVSLHNHINYGFEVTATIVLVKYRQFFGFILVSAGTKLTVVAIIDQNKDDKKKASCLLCIRSITYHPGIVTCELGWVEFCRIPECQRQQALPHPDRLL